MKLQSLALDGVMSIAHRLIKKLIPDPDAQAKALAQLKQMEQKGDLAQLVVNLEEARHESLFVAGWRPFVGWVCAAAFAYAFIVQPFLIFFATASGHDLSTLPALDLATMTPVLMGMLGLGWLRTAEKRAGVNKNR